MSIPTACYFWKDNKVVEWYSPGAITATADMFFNTMYIGLYCIDALTDDPSLKYGKFQESGWKCIPFENFPAEFKTTLLLLGVT